jgi:hypothetical protein
MLESPFCMSKELVRHFREVFIPLAIVVFVAVLGSILGLTLYGRLDKLVPLFAGPTYLFFILAGSGLGYLVNRHQRSRAALWVWVLPAIWSVYGVAGDLSSGIHHGESVLDYIWNVLILPHRELAYVAQWVIGAPFFSAVAYSFGAWLGIRRPPPA